MENYLGWIFTLIPFLLCKLMEKSHWSPQNPFFILMNSLEWLMIAIWIYSLGEHIGSRSREKKDVLAKKLKDELKAECLYEIRNCYSKFENEYVPLKEKVAVQKFELEKEQWRVKVLRDALEEEQTKKKRTPEQANKEAIHSITGGNK